MFHKMTVAQRREAEELAAMLAEHSASIAERMAEAMQRDGVQMDGTTALRAFAQALRITMASEFSVGTVH